jgi:Mg-chelatase subunit ChlD
MTRSFIRRCLARWIAALAFVWCAGAVAQEQRVTDIVLLIDTSASMKEVKVSPGPKGTKTFDDVKARLKLYVDYGLTPGTNVVLITFSDDATVRERIFVRGEADKQKLRAAIDRLRPEGATYMAKGLQLGLEELNRLKKEFPDHYRLLFMMTDGMNEPPQTVPLQDQVTFDKLRERFK